MRGLRCSIGHWQRKIGLCDSDQRGHLNVEADTAVEDRVIQLGPGQPPIPERLLLAHARGQVLFICGAGISLPAGLPDFRTLVLNVYERLDNATHDVLRSIPSNTHSHTQIDCTGLTDRQSAEVRRFFSGDYDVALGMLERRLDNHTTGDSQVRRTVVEILRAGSASPASIHKALISLADRGSARSIVTTNFDLLLQVAAQRNRTPVESYSLGSIPRPSRSADFSGVLHIHGALDKRTERFSELVLSDQDFGEFYLRRRVVPDFIYDAARLYHLVLVGYSGNDPPMRYLLNAVAADGKRFEDLKERFTFFGTQSPDAVVIEDWKGRGITPIHYNSANNHDALRSALERWAALSAINGKSSVLDAQIRKIVKKPRSATDDSERDLFDHLYRRSNTSERVRISALISEAGAEVGWLDALIKITHEARRRQA